MSTSSDDASLELVDLVQAKSPFEAQVIVGVLHAAGVAAYVQGGLLADEFAMSQQLMNLRSVAVQVPAAQAELGRQALAEAHEAGELLSRIDEDGDE